MGYADRACRDSRPCCQTPRDALARRSGSEYAITGLRSRGFLELEARIGDIVQPSAWILSQTSVEHRADRRGCRRRQQLPIGFSLEDEGHGIGHRVALERPAA